MKTKTLKTNKGAVLNVSASIGNDYAKSVTKLIDLMAADIKKEMRSLFDTHSLDGAMDASISSQSRIAINALLDKWEPRFKDVAKNATDKWINRIDKNSSVTLGLSLKDISEQFTLKFDTKDERLMNVIKASTEQAANLIKLIPQEYLGQVQGQVMRSITTGQGLKDLVPFLNEKYNKLRRHAKLVALDQTRKAYTAISAARMEKVGMTKFEWIHSGGGQHPRQQHKDWNGKIFDINDPPEDDKFGPVLPGQAINCRCKMRMILDFGDDEE